MKSPALECAPRSLCLIRARFHQLLCLLRLVSGGSLPAVQPAGCSPTAFLLQFLAAVPKRLCVCSRDSVSAYLHYLPQIALFHFFN